jgi:uncharacterized protein (TIGR00251 family)
MEKVFEVIVNHSSKKDEIKEEDPLKISIKEKPIAGKANSYLIKLLKKHFKAKRVMILKGKTSKKKIIKVEF